MINALYSSKCAGTKMFKLHGIEFGWKAIKDLWQRECARREKGNARMAPKLRESHVLRDSWTKLSKCSPSQDYAGIYTIILVLIQCNKHTSTTLNLQQEVLSELYNHINQQPSPSDQAHVQATLSYLEACSKLFEKGFLSHDQVMSLESEVIKNIFNQDSISFQDGLMLFSRKVLFTFTHTMHIFTF